MPPKQSSPPGRILNIKLLPSDVDRISWLMEETGAVTTIEVIRNALRLAADVESGKLRYKVTSDRSKRAKVKVEEEVKAEAG